MKLHGIQLSPYVRKVAVVLGLKGLTYENIEALPGAFPEGFDKISPLLKIPAFEDDDFAISDSTVICEYLDDRYPQVPSLPKEPVHRAQARWLEEYADTKLVEACGGLFFERIVKPKFFEGDTDQARVDKILSELMPSISDYLEGKAPEQGFLFGDISRADISITSFFINAEYASYTIDANRWPKLSGLVQQVKTNAVVTELLEQEKSLIPQ